MDYYQMLHQHGQFAHVPSNEFIELLEFKLNTLKQAKADDSSWNYNIEELEAQITRIKGFISLLQS